MRPFSSLGVKPFLWMNDGDTQILQKHFIVLSRKYHPDLMASKSDEERQASEGILSEINADFAALKDPWTRLERVLEQNKEALADKATAKNAAKAPPELAASYFELQELWSEEPADSAKVKDETAKFTQQVAERLRVAEEKVQKLLQKYPFSGLGNNPAPWNLEQLLELQSAYQDVKYHRSFLRDIQEKYR